MLFTVSIPSVNLEIHSEGSLGSTVSSTTFPAAAQPFSTDLTEVASGCRPDKSEAVCVLGSMLFDGPLWDVADMS